MPKTDKQFERGVFELFTEAAGISVVPESIEQREPPAPDVICCVSGEMRGFELALLTDPSMEKKVRQGRSGFTRFAQPDATTILSKKLGKAYQAETPIDLVLHEGATPIADLQPLQKKRLLDLLNASALSRFERVWVVRLEPPEVLVCFHLRGKKYRSAARAAFRACTGRDSVP